MAEIYDWPTTAIPPAASTPFRLLSRSLSSQSAFTGERRASGPIVQRFVVNMNWSLLKEPEWRDLDGFLARLGGIARFVRLADPARRQPYYNRLGNKTVEGFSDETLFSDNTGFVSGHLPPYVAADEAAARGAGDIVLRNLPASLHRALRRGDLFEIRPDGLPAPHGHLYEITFDASSNAAGKTRIYFEPPLRAAIAAGDSVVLSDAKSVFRLASDDAGEINTNHALHGTLGLSFIERLPQ